MTGEIVIRGAPRPTARTVDNHLWSPLALGLTGQKFVPAADLCSKALFSNDWSRKLKKPRSLPLPIPLPLAKLLPPLMKGCLIKARPLEAILVIFGRRSLIFFGVKALGKI